MVAVLAGVPEQTSAWVSRRPPTRPAPRRLADLPRYVRPRSPRRPSPAVLVRRRLALLFALAALVVVAVLIAPRFRAALGSDPASTSEGGPINHTYVVHPGDTVWSIAKSIAPGRDPRALVDAITAANGSSDLAVGQVLRLPG